MRIPLWLWALGGWLVFGNKPATRSYSLAVPAGGFSRPELEAAAARLGVPVLNLLVAIVMCSERGRSLSWAHGYRDELLAIGHAIHGRLKYPHAFGRTPWDVVASGKVRTGQTGGHFATSVVPQGELLGLLLELAEQVQNERAAGETRGNPLAYHHHQGEQADETNASWERRGYVQIRPPGTRASDATFFAAGPERARVMT